MELILIQLTDLHISCREDAVALNSRVDSIVGAVSCTIQNPSNTVLLFCVTGDIAYSGKKEQYEDASLFFDSLFEKIQKRYSNLILDFVFVPGNHDCDFSKESQVRKALLSAPNVNVFDKDSFSLLTDIQDEYFSFTQKYVDKSRALGVQKGMIFAEDVIEPEFAPFKIYIHSFNSAWCSQLKEAQGKIGIALPEGVKEKTADDIVITLMHHGDEWFDWSSKEMWETYHKNYSDIVMFGHDHTMRFKQVLNYNESTNYFIRGNQLYSHEDPDNSGFNVLKIDMDEQREMFISYLWNSKEKIYEEVGTPIYRPFVKNRFKDTGCRIKRSKIEWLEENEIDITCRYKENLKRSDLFVFPVVQSIDEKGNRKNYREAAEVIQLIGNKKRVYFDGEKEYGKTAVLKYLFKEYYDAGQYPIFLMHTDIVSADEPEIRKLIRNKYDEMYESINIDKLMQLENEKRVCLIDDFDLVKISDKSQKKFLEFIGSLFDLVILSTNMKSSVMNGFNRLETNDYLEGNYHKLEICKLRHLIKKQLVEKWILLEDPSQDVNTIQFDLKTKEKMSQIDEVLKKGYFSDTPIEFLLVLSYLDNGQNSDYSRYSYIYDSLIRDKINTIGEGDTSICSAYKTILEIVAYNLYKEGAEGYFDEEILLVAIDQYKKEYTSLNKRNSVIVEKLIEGKVFEANEDNLKFKHNYMYYYFVGSYIHDIMSYSERDQIIKEIISDLYLDINYNVALFLAYSLNTEYSVLPAAKEVEESLLKEFADYKYEKQNDFLQKINAGLFEKINESYNIPKNADIHQKQKELIIKQDEVEAEMENYEESDGDDEQFDECFKNFIRLLRLIQFEGDILKNYSTKIKTAPRREMIRMMGASNMKLLGYLCSTFSNETDKILEIVEAKLREQEPEDSISSHKLLKAIKEYIALLWRQYISINVDNLAICLDCNLLNKDLIDYKDEIQSTFFDMVYIEYLIRISDGTLPVDEIRKCFEGKDKIDSFSQSILKEIIASYMMTNQYNVKDKEKICNMLHFGYKSMYIEEKKQESQGLLA